MKKALTCPKCGSTDVISDARVIDRGNFTIPGTLAIEVRDTYKGTRSVPVSAWMCEMCGYIELYAAPKRTN